jgi:hypothetical protein
MQEPVASAFSIESIVEKILRSRRITREDQHLLLTPHPLNVQEQRLIDQVFDRLRSGFLRVVD